MPRTPWLLAAAGILFLPGALTPLQAQREPAGEWRSYAGTPRGLKYSPLDQITKDNVNDLQIAWKWSSVELELQKSSPVLRVSRNENTPLMANGVSAISSCQITRVPSCLIPQMRPVE